MRGDLIVLAAAAAAAGVAVFALLRWREHLPCAHPSARSLHDRPVPRVGGVAIWAAALPVGLAFPPPLAGSGLAFPPPLAGSGLAWIVAWCAVAGVSLRDDFRAVPVAVRLSVHVGAAGLVAATMFAPTDAQGFVAFVAAALAIAWGMNLYNFMDGSDGLAATMTIAGFGAYAAALAWRGEPWLACAALVVGAAVFLGANRPRAALFMGDVGAVPLGMLAAAVGIDGFVRGAWPAWFAPLAFLPFLLDASVTLARRLLRGERVVQAHRSHYYQRLLRMGCGHSGTLAVYATLMAACAAAAVACLAWAPAAGPSALAVLVAVHAALFATIDYHWGRTAETR